MPRLKSSHAKKLGKALYEKNPTIKEATDNWLGLNGKKSVAESIANGTKNAIESAYKEITGQNSAARANEQTQEWMKTFMNYNNEQAKLANEEQWRMLEAQMRFNSAQAAQANAFSEHMWNETAGYNAAQAEYARGFSAEEAEKNRQWQEYMSSTAHQREIEDLKAAGLNPILSVTGGNGAAMGSGAQGQTMEASTGAISGQAISAALANAHKAEMYATSAAMENSSNALGLFGMIAAGALGLISGKMNGLSKTLYNIKRFH